jgi:predicted ATP-grasp superfamily ATP-dependent carboligase
VRVFIYEHITGGGAFDAALTDAPSGSLLAEGTAMVRCLAADFAALPGVRVCGLCDNRLPGFAVASSCFQPVDSAASHWRAFDQLAARCDATVLIAPELCGILSDCCRRATSAGATLISPGESAVALASNKFELTRRVSSEGVPVPRTRAVSYGESLPRGFSYPAVLKPAFGAGSTDVRMIRSPTDWRWPGDCRKTSQWLLQEFCHGTPVSVAFVCSRGASYPLLPCGQRITADGRFRYLGGELPLPMELAQRAIELAGTAVGRVLTGAVGYLGVDLILGDDPRGNEDRLIEINPRLTTSYVGLRAAAQTNLAAAMLAVAEDRLPDLRFSRESLEFDADGTVRRLLKKSWGKLPAYQEPN